MALKRRGTPPFAMGYSNAAHKGKKLDETLDETERFHRNWSDDFAEWSDV